VSPEEQVQKLIIDQLAGIRADLTGLGDKVDRKFDLVAQRANTESGTLHGRINRVAEGQVECSSDFRGLRTRVNWLYIIAGGLFLSLAGTVFGLVSRGG
jgi:hypothetical protein